MAAILTRLTPLMIAVAIGFLCGAAFESGWHGHAVQYDGETP